MRQRVNSHFFLLKRAAHFFKSSLYVWNGFERFPARPRPEAEARGLGCGEARRPAASPSQRPRGAAEPLASPGPNANRNWAIPSRTAPHHFSASSNLKLFGMNIRNPTATSQAQLNLGSPDLGWYNTEKNRAWRGPILPCPSPHWLYINGL